MTSSSHVFVASELLNIITPTLVVVILATIVMCHCLIIYARVFYEVWQVECAIVKAQGNERIFSKVSWLSWSSGKQWCQLPATRCTVSNTPTLCGRTGPISMCVYIGWDWKSGEQAGCGWLHTSPPGSSTRLGGKVRVASTVLFSVHASWKDQRSYLSSSCLWICSIKVAVMHAGVWSTCYSTRPTPECRTTTATLQSTTLWRAVIRQAWSSCCQLLACLSVSVVMTCPRWPLYT